MSVFISEIRLDTIHYGNNTEQNMLRDFQELYLVLFFFGGGVDLGIDCSG